MKLRQLASILYAALVAGVFLMSACTDRQDFGPLRLEERNMRLEEVQRYRDRLAKGSLSEAIAASEHEDALVRKYAVRRLGELEEKSRHESPSINEVRAAVSRGIKALEGKLSNASDVDAPVASSNDSAEETPAQDASHDTLKPLPEPSEAVRVLVSRLGEDKDRSVRLEAAGALAKSQDVNAIMPLIRAMTDADRKVRTWAWKGVLAFEEMGLTVLIDHLALESPIDDRTFVDEVGKSVPHQAIARERLASLDKKWVPFLSEQLNHPDVFAAMRVCLSLGEMGKEAKDAVAILLEKTFHKNPEFRRYAARALGKIGAVDPKVVPRLKEMRDKDSDKAVVTEAKRALDHIEAEKKEAEKKKKDKEDDE